MPKLFVADATGTYQAAKGLWVADATGTYKAALSGYVADATGTYVSSGVGGPSVSALAVTPGTVAWSHLTATWTAANATSYAIYQVGNATPLWTGSASPVSLAIIPNTAYALFVRAIGTGGAYIDSAVTNYTTPSLPSPTGLHTTAAPAYNGFNLAWNAVADATSYQINKTDGTVVYTGPWVTSVHVAAAASSSYYFGIKAMLGSANSGWSPTLTVVTPAVPGPTFGDYLFDPNSASTWETSSGGSWRSSSDGQYHGNGSAYGSTRGNQSGWFFYGASPYSGLAGGRVTAFAVHMHRTDDSGASSGQSCHWNLHNYSGRPGGSPLGGIIAETNADTLDRGESKWITLPTSWGQQLVNGSARGVAWGNVSGRYMRCDPISGDNWNGRFRITIG